jgi:hypothetical protein
MLQTVRFSPATRLAPSASSTPSVTQAKNVQRQGLSPGYLKSASKKFLQVKQRGATEFRSPLTTLAQLAKHYASVLRNINSPESIDAIGSFKETYGVLSREPGQSEAQRDLLTSYVEGIPTTQEVATPLAEEFSTLAADINAYIESIEN